MIKFLSLLMGSTLFVQAVSAAASDLDLSFGSVGVAAAAIGKASFDQAFAAALQPDGKIIIAGDVATNNSNFSAEPGRMVLVRFNPDGSLDNGFGRNGKASKFSTGSCRATAVAVQSDGKILAAGFCMIADSVGSFHQHFMVTRFDAEGTVDNSYGNGGIVTTSFGNGLHSTLTSAVLQPDGRLVAVGYTFFNSSSPLSIAVARYNIDGTLDPTFDDDGMALVNVGATGNRANSVALQSDGKIVIGGNLKASIGSSTDFALVRLIQNGSLDNSFDGDGKVTTKIGNASSVSTVRIQSDGKILAAGNTTGSTRDVAVARYNADGSADTSFDGDGVVVTNIDDDVANAMAIQPDGKIVIAGVVILTGGQPPSYLSIRYNLDGSLDNSYNGTGFVSTQILASAANRPTSVLMQDDGRIILTGTSTSIISGSIVNADLSAARYNADGSLDPSFNEEGTLTLELGCSSDIASDVALQPDGKAVAVGTSYDAEQINLSIARFRTDGSPDTLFGNEGAVIKKFSEGSVFPGGVVVQPDGKIIVVASTFEGTAIFVLRFTTNGALDASFGTGGIAKLTPGPMSNLAYAIAVQTDGKLIVAGSSFDATGSGGNTLVRLNADGTIDPTFGGGGNVVVPDSDQSSVVYSVNVLPDGRIVAGAGALGMTSGGNQMFAVFRLLPTGTLDKSFGGTGIVHTAFDIQGNIQSIKSQPDGKIIAGGYGFGGYVLARYNDDGTLDTTFGGDGKVTTQIQPNAFFSLRDVELQSDGKIIVCGDAPKGSLSAGSLIRYRQDGSLDFSFGAGGRTITQPGKGDAGFLSVSVRSDGRILAGGYSNNGIDYDFTLVQYLGGSAASRTHFDFDGDAKADLAVRRPADNVWYFLRTTAGYTELQYGEAGDLMAPADYDGDGKTDVAVFRPATGTWFVAGSSVGFYSDGWGADGDIPVPADYDGDGKDDIAVYRPSNGTWYRKLSSGAISNVQFGTAEDKPQLGDFDGDGKADLAVLRPSTNVWYFLRTTAGFTGIGWGADGDVAAPTDYDGDGKTDPAVFRASTGVWFVAGSSAGFFTRNWGAAGDVPVSADYDGDGKADVAVFRPSNNTWYLQTSGSGLAQYQFGAAGDKPIPSVFAY